MDRPGSFIIAPLDGMRQLHHVGDGVRLEQVLVVEMVEKNAQPTFSIINLCLERGWRTALDTLHVPRKNFENGHSICRDVLAITRCFCWKGSQLRHGIKICGLTYGIWEVLG